MVAGDPARLRLNREALRTERGKVHLAGEGAEVRALLRGEGEFDEPIHPNAVVLDLSSPESDWPAIAGAIVQARLTGPVIAIEWLDEAPGGERGDGAGERQAPPGADLSRLVRRSILEKRRQDERTAAHLNGMVPAAAGGGMEGGLITGSGGADGPGSHAGIGQSWIHLTLRDGTEAGILEGMAAFRALAAGLPCGRSARPRASPAAAGSVWSNELICQVVERYAPLAETRGVRLLEIYDDYAPRISADGAGLLAALGVLTTCTLHLARPGQAIRVSAWVGGDDAMSFGVSIDGTGIAEEHLPLLADAFAVASPILEGYGAWLGFGSSWGKSCGFHFELPASLSEPGTLYEHDASEDHDGSAP